MKKILIALMLFTMAVSCSKKDENEKPIDFFDQRCFVVYSVNKNDSSCQSKFTVVYVTKNDYTSNTPDSYWEKKTMCLHDDYLKISNSESFFAIGSIVCRDIRKFEEEI